MSVHHSHPFHSCEIDYIDELLLSLRVDVGCWCCWWLAALLCYGSSCFASTSYKRRISGEKPFSFLRSEKSTHMRIRTHTHGKRFVRPMGAITLVCSVVPANDSCVHKYQNMELNRVLVRSMLSQKYWQMDYLFD